MAGDKFGAAHGGELVDHGLAVFRGDAVDINEGSHPFGAEFGYSSDDHAGVGVAD